MQGNAKYLAATLLTASLAAMGCRERAATRADSGITASGAAPAAAAPAVPAPSRLPPAVRAASRRTGAAQLPSATSQTQSTATRADSSSTATTTGGSNATITPAPATTPAGPSALAIALAHLPFQDGERLEYQVKYGFLGVGSATLQVLGLDSVRGTPTVHAQFTVQGGIRIYRVNDRYESWFDPETYTTIRTIQHIDEGSYDRDRDYEFYPARQTMSENGKPDTATVPAPLDEASFLFFLRSIPLEVGHTYTFDRYFRPDRNPVTVEVLRKEQVKVPAGTFNTLVVRPIIKTGGIFGEGGRAEVWFTDDSTRTLVQLKSKLKFGSLNLYLRSRQVGAPWPGAAPSP